MSERSSDRSARSGRADADGDGAGDGAKLGEFIKEQRRLAELSVRRLAELAGVSNPYLSQIERGLRRPSAEILQQIAKALEISSETLYVQAGILDAERSPAPSDLETAIRRATELTEDQRAALLSVYRSFLPLGSSSDREDLEAT